MLELESASALELGFAAAAGLQKRAALELEIEALELKVAPLELEFAPAAMELESAAASDWNWNLRQRWNYK